MNYLLFITSFLLLNFPLIYSQNNVSPEMVKERNICFDSTTRDYQKSIDYFQKMIEKDSTDLEARYNLSMSYYKLVNEEGYKKAIIHWNFIINRDLCYNYALMNRALCKYFIKDFEGACTDMKKANNCNYPDKSDIEGYLNLFCGKKKN